MKNVLKKLFNIQQELKVPKNQRNTFGNYNFRSCEDIMEASKPICAKYNCLLLCSDLITYIGDRYYVQATAKLFDLDSEEYVEVTASAREEETKKGMDASQITGASSSYARKYALNGLLQLDDNKDPDTNEYLKQQNRTNNKPQKTVSNSNLKVEMITDEQIKLLHTLFSKVPNSEEEKKKLYTKAKITSSKELTKKNASVMIDYLKKLIGE